MTITPHELNSILARGFTDLGRPENMGKSFVVCADKIAVFPCPDYEHRIYKTSYGYLIERPYSTDGTYFVPEGCERIR